MEMKQNYALKILALFLILTSYSIGAQNQTQVQEIKKDYNLAELKKLKEKLQAEQVEQRRKALRLAQANNWPITYTKEGVFYGLVGVPQKENRFITKRITLLRPDLLEPIGYMMEAD